LQQALGGVVGAGGVAAVEHPGQWVGQQGAAGVDGRGRQGRGHRQRLDHLLHGQIGRVGITDCP